MKEVLADTGPLYASAVQSDQFHERTRVDLRRLVAEDRNIIVIYPTLFETYRLILIRTALPYAHTWLANMMRRVTMINPLDADYADAINEVHRYPDQPISLADALLGVVSVRMSLPIWTYDHHFDVMRVSVWR